MTDIQSFCRKEVLSGTFASIMASVMTYLLVFRAAPSMDMRGIGNFAFDILPQTAGVAFFSAMVTGLKLRKHPALIGAALSLSSTCRLVLLLVGLSVIMFGGIGFGLLHFSGFPSIGFWTGLLFKIAWGGIVSMIAVLFVIKWMITKVQSQ